ncbi:MAG TPA: 30S ribosomal protein S4 [Candidatus Omnitrophica bacterium]|nr:MAG: 30S ribosomal protein S4 [Omnitrophica WOR_2 bacterium GWA2_45_18]OGX19717.1 MAG: 30S ribosomal protein S4 [Omnitrophica WOR_2 bacterium GWC2_45_7]HBR14662.1 30S ribosomal protein S4 [Candidatus Omnitrophota bacterium]
MGKYVGSSCRLCRREGEKLNLKGTRCGTHRCAVERRSYAPGQHGSGKRVKLSNYGIQLREKQKVKRIYGLVERQFKNYFLMATEKKGVTGSMLLQFLERRLDNVIYQLGFCSSRRQARQLVGHGFVFVNDHRVDIPSFLVKTNDEIFIRFKKKGQKTVQDNIEACKERKVPTWLEVDHNHFKANVKRLPEREDIGYPVNEQLIVELYSR